MTANLRQRVDFFNALRDDVPKDIVNHEREAEADVVNSRAYLQGILEFGMQSPESE